MSCSDIEVEIDIENSNLFVDLSRLDNDLLVSGDQRK
jgi:hypothetical protein